MTGRIVVLLSMLATGCATPLATGVNTVTVPATVTEKCVNAADVPVIPPTATDPNGNLRQLAAGTAADARQLRQVAQEQNALLIRCSQ